MSICKCPCLTQVRLKNCVLDDLKITNNDFSKRNNILTFSNIMDFDFNNSVM